MLPAQRYFCTQKRNFTIQRLKPLYDLIIYLKILYRKQSSKIQRLFELCNWLGGGGMIE